MELKRGRIFKKNMHKKVKINKTKKDRQTENEKCCAKNNKERERDIKRKGKKHTQ